VSHVEKVIKGEDIYRFVLVREKVGGEMWNTSSGERRTKATFIRRHELG
jgi:hypothetical protein